LFAAKESFTTSSCYPEPAGSSLGETRERKGSAPLQPCVRQIPCSKPELQQAPGQAD